jgi:hypothetical protein
VTVLSRVTKCVVLPLALQRSFGTEIADTLRTAAKQPELAAQLIFPTCRGIEMTYQTSFLIVLVLQFVGLAGLGITLSLDRSRLRFLYVVILAGLVVVELGMAVMLHAAGNANWLICAVTCGVIAFGVLIERGRPLAWR